MKKLIFLILLCITPNLSFADKYIIYTSSQVNSKSEVFVRFPHPYTLYNSRERCEMDLIKIHLPKKFHLRALNSADRLFIIEYTGAGNVHKTT